VTQPAPQALPVVTLFEGGSALSDFRARQLLPKLQAIEPRIEGISARFVHLVVTDAALDAAGRDRFAALLTYG
jgi:phosphoribosylformylglycinamidine synthase